jgi:diguanylate cyclase (GGDEF)-like protein
VSALVAAVVVASALSVLVPTHRSLADAKRSLVPPVRSLDRAEESYRRTTAALQSAVSPDEATRNDALSELTALNARGDAAWNHYRRIAVGLPGERALLQQFDAHRQEALTAGTDFVTSREAGAAALGTLTNSSAQLAEDLDRIKDLYHARTERALDDAAANVGDASRNLLLIAVPSVALLIIAFALAARSARLREERLVSLDALLRKDAERNELEARLQRSLEMARDEDGAFALVGRALQQTAPGCAAELLVADSSRAHFRQATATSEHGGPGCPVMTPGDCPAAIWGQTQVWPSSRALDACPYLRDRPAGECSALCVPVSISGNTIGVVHATAPDEHPPDEGTTGAVELIARKVGERVGMLRAFRRSETQAHTDPLTGLLNRRSVEEKVRILVDGGHSFAIAYGDLDHFKQLNDVHGHDAGDQALRLFARVMRDAVRPEDLTARWGGEEFVVVLPDCAIGDAFTVINRLRERLERVQAGSHLPRFTVSFGLAVSRPEDTFSQSLELADSALLKAKAAGRNRVVIAGDSDVRAPATTKTPARSTTTNGS